jgi:hypothetical protein
MSSRRPRCNKQQQRELTSVNSLGADRIHRSFRVCPETSVLQIVEVTGASNMYRETPLPNAVYLVQSLYELQGIIVLLSQGFLSPVRMNWKAAPRQRRSPTIGSRGHCER